MNMANKLRITSYNCKHYKNSGDKFDFINTLTCKTDFLFFTRNMSVSLIVSQSY